MTGNKDVKTDSVDGDIEKEPFQLGKYLLWGLVIVLFPFFSIPIMVFILAPIIGDEEAAQVGDMFGVVNTLFSGLAFLGLIVALAMQRSELELQRRELRHNTNALKGSAAALNDQVLLMHYSSLFSALPILIQQEKERLHTLVPDVVTAPERAGVSLQIIARHESAIRTKVLKTEESTAYMKAQLAKGNNNSDNSDNSDNSFERLIGINDDNLRRFDECFISLDTLRKHLILLETIKDRFHYGVGSDLEAFTNWKD